MTRTIGVAAGLVALLAAPGQAAVGTSGPFAGALRQGETQVHRFDNNPLRQGCPQVMTTYGVTLTYAPASDVLTLSVGTRTVTGANGVAAMTFAGSYCTAFDVRVTGTSVARVAAYTVTVTRGSAALT